MTSRIRQACLKSLAIAIFAASAGWVGGCAAPQPSAPLPPEVAMMIGPKARQVASGKPPLRYKVSQPGSISVIDLTMKQMIAFGMVGKSGSTVVIDPVENAVLIKDPKQPALKDVLAGQVDADHDYAIYFAPTEKR